MSQSLSVEELVQNPLTLVQACIPAKPIHDLRKSESWGVPEALIQTLRLDGHVSESLLARIPSLNDGFTNLAPNMLVRFRCMVQDTLEPEFYTGVYEVSDNATGSTSIRTLKYREPSMDDHDEGDIVTDNPPMYDRGVLYCVSIPGEADWVHRHLSEELAQGEYGHGNVEDVKASDNDAQGRRGVRRTRDVQEEDSMMNTGDSMSPSSSSTSSSSAPSTTTSSSTSSSSSFSAVPLYQSPVRRRHDGPDDMMTAVDGNINGRAPSSSSSSSYVNLANVEGPTSFRGRPACIVKVYDGDIDAFKIGDVVEFVGVLSIVRDEQDLAPFRNATHDDDDTGMWGFDASYHRDAMCGICGNSRQKNSNSGRVQNGRSANGVGEGEEEEEEEGYRRNGAAGMEGKSSSSSSGDGSRGGGAVTSSDATSCSCMTSDRGNVLDSFDHIGSSSTYPYKLHAITHRRLCNATALVPPLALNTRAQPAQGNRAASTSTTKASARNGSGSAVTPALAVYGPPKPSSSFASSSSSSSLSSTFSLSSYTPASAFFSSFLVDASSAPSSASMVSPSASTSASPTSVSFRYPFDEPTQQQQQQQPIAHVALSTLRGLLLATLTNIYAGDQLAAEYVLLCLVGRIYRRTGHQQLGRLNVAVSNLGAACKSVILSNTSSSGGGSGSSGSSSTASSLPASDLGAAVVAQMKSIRSVMTKLLSVLTPKSVDFSLSINDLNASRWSPVRDHELERIVPSPLQLSNETFLVLDETVLGEGQLNHTGVKNLQALTKILQDSVVPYEIAFGMQPIELAVDAQAIVLSQGTKPLLPTDVVVPLVASKPPLTELPRWLQDEFGPDSSSSTSSSSSSSHAGRSTSSAGPCDDLVLESEEGMQISEHLALPLLRRYLLLVRKLQLDDLDDAIAEKVQTYFVSRRGLDRSFGEQEMHMRLNLARLAAISFGETSLSEQRWQYANQLADLLSARKSS